MTIFIKFVSVLAQFTETKYLRRLNETEVIVHGQHSSGMILHGSVKLPLIKDLASPLVVFINSAWKETTYLMVM